MHELGFYCLAGGAKTPRDLIRECQEAERTGLGSGFLSERFHVKEAATACGAMGAVTERLGIGTGVTNLTTRHPVVLAAHATTMHRLTGGRYMLGLGRGIVPQMRGMGLGTTTTAELEEGVALLRRLWRGEVVMGYEGRLGSFPGIVLDTTFDEDIPLGLVAFGPNSLALGGRLFDAVVLHTFFTDETTARMVRIVRDAAEQAGRDPASVRIWSVLATVGDHVPYETQLMKTVGRLATYLQAYGDLMVETNGWDPAVLARFRADPKVAAFAGAIDQRATVEELEHFATLIPDEWLAPSASGSAESCAKTVLGQFDLGVDSVILHGADPLELEPVVDAYRQVRPHERFAHLAANPGAFART